MNTIAHVASEQVRRVVMGYDSRAGHAAGADAHDASSWRARWKKARGGW